MANRRDESEVLDKTEARQAVAGHKVNVVLIVSLTLAIVVGAILIAWA